MSNYMKSFKIQSSLDKNISTGQSLKSEIFDYKSKKINSICQ